MNATLEEALENAGTNTLSRPGGDTTLASHVLNVDEVREYEEEVHLIGPRAEGEHRAYDGPYADLEDERNAWTAAQEAGQTGRTRELLEDEPEAPAEPDSARREKEQREREQREKEQREKEQRSR